MNRGFFTKQRDVVRVASCAAESLLFTNVRDDSVWILMSVEGFMLLLQLLKLKANCHWVNSENLVGKVTDAASTSCSLSRIEFTETYVSLRGDAFYAEALPRKDGSFSLYPLQLYLSILFFNMYSEEVPSGSYVLQVESTDYSYYPVSLESIQVHSH